MGVWDLESFVKSSVRDGFKPVSVQNEIALFKEMRKDQKPILVFDSMSLVLLLCARPDEILCGGRHQMFTRILDELFAKLSKNAELVFFQDGQIADTKFPTWSARQNKKYNNDINTMEKIYDKFPLHRIAEGYVYTKTMMTAIEETCKKYGKLNFAVKSECDQELARYACSNSRVLAVFSNDSDFLIFPGHWRYFSTKDLQLDTLNTKEYNRASLHSLLKLSNNQLAIFATIAGNDIVKHDELKRFHTKFDFRVDSKFPSFAKFIKNNFNGKNNHDSNVRQLAQTIFRSTKQHNLDLVDSSIRFYDVKTKDSSPENPLNIHLKQHNLFTFQLLNGSPTNLSLVFFDCRQTDMPSYFDISVPLVQRQAGVLFRHSQSEFPHLKIYSKVSHGTKYGKLALTPIWPPFDVPVIKDLYSDDPKFDKSRFQLLKWTVNWEKLENFDLRRIPSNYMIDVLTLVYLLHTKVIKSKEADLILWTIKNVENGTIIRNIRPPEILNPRAFRVAFIYVKMFANVARCIEVCGLKKRYWKPCNFDGVFFHLEYLNYENQFFDTYKLLNQL